MKASDRSYESFPKSVERSLRREHGHRLVGKFEEAFPAQVFSICGEHVRRSVGEDEYDISRFDPNALLRVEFASDKANG